MRFPLPSRLTICGMDYTTVVLRPGEPLPAGMGEHDEAFWDAWKGVMYFREGILSNYTRARDAYVHELIHCTLDGSGAGRFLRQTKNAEEDFNHVFTPALIQTLEAGRLLRRRR